VEKSINHLLSGDKIVEFGIASFDLHFYQTCITSAYNDLLSSPIPWNQ
jgi:hypothetical protein